MTKKLVYEIDGLEFSEAVEKGVVVNAEARMTEDCQKGIAKYLGK